jgi:predicted AAA+ superfamily ATPase
MEYIKRLLNIEADVKSKSVFLFGPRQTGKTSLLRSLFPGAPTFNLLNSDTFTALSARPAQMRLDLLQTPSRWTELPIIVDEIQKLPGLLDEIHLCIEEHGMKFVVTGSSPRKLKRGDVNLLGGRARTRRLFPLVYREIPNFSLDRALHFGTIPSIYFSDDPTDDLLSYAGNYLLQEIVNEGLVRRIENFSRFLQTAALSNTELINFESIARDAMVPARTIREYCSILEDTLVAVQLKPYGRDLHRKAVSTSKLYFFDIGVANALVKSFSFGDKSTEYGKCFEHFIFTELWAYLSYARDLRPLTFYRDQGGLEIDFVVGDDIALEVKSTTSVQEKHVKALRMAAEAGSFKHSILVSRDPQPRTIDRIEALPYDIFLTKLYTGEYC